MLAWNFSLILHLSSEVAGLVVRYNEFMKLSDRDCFSRRIGIRNDTNSVIYMRFDESNPYRRNVSGGVLGTR